MSDLVGNPEDKFSFVMTPMFCVIYLQENEDWYAVYPGQHIQL